MTGVQIDVQDAELQSALAGLIEAGSDLTVPMDEIGAMLVASVIRRFETETDPEGQRWQPSQRALAEGGQTLTDQAFLRQSITHVASADRVEVGTNLIYGAIHQFGGRAGRGGATELPARPYLGLDDGDRAEIISILRDHLLAGAA